MHDTKIEMKLEEETKKLSEICEKLVDAAKSEVEKGIQNVETEEFGKVIDAIKDLCDAKEKVVKKCYYATILKEMEKAEDEDKEEEKYLMRILKEERSDELKRMQEQYGEDEGEKRFYDNWRYKSSGRFAPRGRGTRYGRRSYTEPYYHVMPDYGEYYPEYYRDMDKELRQKLYYSSGGYGGSGFSGNSSGGGNNGNSGGSTGGGNLSRGYSDGFSDGQTRGYSDGYSDGQRDGRRNNGGNNSRYDRAKRGYTETKMSDDGTPESKKKSMESLDHYMKELADDMTELVGNMDNSEKTMLKTRLQTLAQKLQ